MILLHHFVFDLDQLILMTMKNLMMNMMYFYFFHFYHQLLLENKVQHKIIIQVYHHILYELKNIFFILNILIVIKIKIYHDMLIEQAFDRHFAMIPLRIVNPFIFIILYCLIEKLNK